MSTSGRAAEKTTDEFAAFSEIYDAWVTTARATVHHVPFYVEEFVRAGGPCVEVGVGNGRITIEAAKRGVDITGVDVSPAMIALCRGRAEAAGVVDRIRFVESDMRTFQLAAPAAMIAIPFSTVGHAVSLEDKGVLFRHVRSQLAAGGRFVFDTLIFDPAYAAAHRDVARLRAEIKDAATGQDAVVWETVRYDLPNQRMRIIVATDFVGADGVVLRRRYSRMDFSWIEPDQARALLTDSGFDVEDCFGGFDRSPRTPQSQTQIWVARAR